MRDLKDMHILHRLKAPTPAFFKKLRKWGGYLTTASVIIIAANSQYHMGLPEFVDQIGKVVAYVGFTAATVSSFAVDQEKLEEREKQDS